MKELCLALSMIAFTSLCLGHLAFAILMLASLAQTIAES